MISASRHINFLNTGINSSRENKRRSTTKRKNILVSRVKRKASRRVSCAGEAFSGKVESYLEARTKDKDKDNDFSRDETSCVCLHFF